MTNAATRGLLELSPEASTVSPVLSVKPRGVAPFHNGRLVLLREGHMDVKSRYITIFSIALNIFFAVNYFALKPDLSELNRTDTNPIVTVEPASKNSGSDSDDLNEVYLSLIKQGLSQDQTKSVLFTKLKQQYVDTIEKPNDQFWLYQPLAQIEYMEALSVGYQQVRLCKSLSSLRHDYHYKSAEWS